MDRAGQVTRILSRLSAGEEKAFEELLPLVYDELRALAARYMRGERPGHTLQATALTHEAWIRLAGEADAGVHDRAHFMAVAARAMRHILVEHARARGRLKRGGDRKAARIPTGGELPGEPSPDFAAVVPPPPDLDLLALDDALTRLAEFEPRKARVVEVLYFGGMTSAEAAELLGVTSRTVERDWRFARLWLLRELTGEKK